MSKYQSYSEYKDSGVECFGEVPSNWRVAGFKKYIESIVDYRGKTPNKTDDGILLVTARNIKNGQLDYSLSQEFIAEVDYEEVMSRGKPELGEVLFTTEAPLGEVANVDRTNIALAQRVIKFNGKAGILDNYYLKYLIMSKEFQQSLYLYASGSTVKGIKAERFVYLRALLPHISEQQKIANFLDHETAKIDTLIEKQQQLIKLLKEKRQAVISHAVTKGLNPNAPMRDSGVEWLGEVPEHWDVCLIKHKCEEITDGAHVSPETDDGEHYFVSIVDIKNGVINFDGALLTSESSYQYLIKTGCKPFPGDILFSKDGTIGQTAVTPSGVDFVVASSLIIIRPNRENVIPHYLDSLLQSEVVKEQVESFVKGAALRRLSIQNLLKIYGVFPPVEEQAQIVSYLRVQLDKYDSLENKATDLIRLLQERRTALISAAVTGKIDVRNWQPPADSSANHTREPLQEAIP